MHAADALDHPLTRKLIYLLVLILVLLGWPRVAAATALDDYVAAPDASYGWTHVNTINGGNYTGYVLDMTSQTWRDPSEVDRTQWQHWLTVIQPDTVSSTKALLWINGGGNGGSPPGSVDSMLRTIATTTSTVVADLRMVPNQPLKFADESDPRYITSGRYEDELIAYTWDKFLTTADATWPARLPMTKAAVRAMDTITAFCGSPAGGSITVDQFVVAGASKRGWTTWTTAAVDDRVIGIVPVVIDVLNVEASMAHHFAALGFWAPAIHDYEDMGIMDWFSTPQMDALMLIEDPYFYRTRYTMPKFMINSTGDQFFLPDSAQFYFDDLPGEKHLRYPPNTDHGLGGSDADQSLLVYYQSIVSGWALPEFSWTLEPDGSIQVQTVTTPAQVKLWQATNPAARDFRKDVIGSAYSSSPMSDQGGGLYVGQVSEPPTGWRAFYVELIFDSPGTIDYKFTTEVRVVPDRLPYIADLDRDGDTDGADFLTFSNCFNGALHPIGPYPDCENPYADLDKDGDIDGTDFLTFSNCFNGSLNPPNCP